MKLIKISDTELELTKTVKEIYHKDELERRKAKLEEGLVIVNELLDALK